MLSILVVVSGLGVFASADALSQLGLTPGDAKQMTIDSVSSGYVPLGFIARPFKAASPAVRAQLVQGGLAWAKAYVATPEFAAAYAKMRESRKPEEPKFEGTPEQEFERDRVKQQAEAAKNQEDMKKMLAQMTPEQRKQIEETIKQVAEIQKAQDTPQMKAMMIQGIASDRANKVEEYQNDMKKWAEDFPEQPSVLVARRLRRFLDISSTVDFDAKLQSSDGRMRFVNPAYESKGDEWKLCFRAGKEATTAAREAAQAWLKELPAK